MAADPTTQEQGIKCVPSWIVHVIIALIITTSAIFNTFVIRFTWKELKTNRTTYVICLFCMSVNNLAATCFNLPLHYIEFYTTNIITHVPLQLANAICFVRFVSMFTCLGVGICALNIICWDRYEALTRLGKERRITPTVARRAILGALLFVIIFVICSKTSALQQMADGIPYCFIRQCYNQHFTNDIGQRIKKTSVPIIVLVSAIFVSSKTIAIFTFYSITKQVRRHIVEVRETLGNLNATKELNLVKVSVVIFTAYTITWLPYGISTTLINVMPSNAGISCFFYTSYYLIAYSLFSILPLLCVITDKKMKSKLRRAFAKNRATRVGPASSNQVVMQSTNTFGSR